MQYSQATSPNKNILSNNFWKIYELNFQEIKLRYLLWAIDSFKIPTNEQLFLKFQWCSDCFKIINSKYGNLFSISPFGAGVMYFKNSQKKHLIIKNRDKTSNQISAELTDQTNHIKTCVHNAIKLKRYRLAESYIMNFFWIKLGPHELLFDEQPLPNWNFKNKPTEVTTCDELRSLFINAIRFGQRIDQKYIKMISKELPVKNKKKSKSNFLSHYMKWNKYGMCSFDCGPVLWSKKSFVGFSKIRTVMKKEGWPWSNREAIDLLKPLYKIALNYREHPALYDIELVSEGHDLETLKSKRKDIVKIVKMLLNEIKIEKKKLSVN